MGVDPAAPEGRMTRAELIAKLEAATEGSRQLDGEIGRAVGYVASSWWGAIAFRWNEGECWGSVPDFTTSLDAALTLVPEGWGWLARSHDGSPAYDGTGRGRGGFANVNIGRDDAQFFTEFAATPALALCIAALRAREAA